MKKKIGIWLLAPTLWLALGSCDILTQVAGGVMTTVDPTETEIVGGLKEALANGASNAVGVLALEGGYLNDPLVKIPFPQEVSVVEKTLRDIGAGALVDNFVEKLNRGAESGAKMALPVFKQAILDMTLVDAKNILLGGETAATDYFKAKTSAALYTAYAPHIKTSLDQVNATKLWSDVTTRYNSIPLVRTKVDTDIVRYATNKALDGLFLKLADEEKKIRANPIARTSELLKKVFSYYDRQKSAGQ